MYNKLYLTPLEEKSIFPSTNNAIKKNYKINHRTYVLRPLIGTQREE